MQFSSGFLGPCRAIMKPFQAALYSLVSHTGQRWARTNPLLVQSVVFSLQCFVYNVVCAVYRMQCAVCTVWCLLFVVQDRVFSVTDALGTCYIGSTELLTLNYTRPDTGQQSHSLETGIEQSDGDQGKKNQVQFCVRKTCWLNIYKNIDTKKKYFSLKIVQVQGIIVVS